MARIERRVDGHSMSCRHERVCPLRKLMVLDSYGEMFEPWVMRDDAVLGLRVRTSAARAPIQQQPRRVH